MLKGTPFLAYRHSCRFTTMPEEPKISTNIPILMLVSCVKPQKIYERRVLGKFLGVQTSVCNEIFDFVIPKLRFGAKATLHS
jgi:hypothetical protein